MEIAIALIQQGDEFLFQLREGERRIGAVGLIGCFGGQIQENETEQEAVARELIEETSFETKPEEWIKIGEVDVDSDRDHKSVRIHAHVFANRLSTDETITANEGQLVRMTLMQAKRSKEKLTPATKAVFEQLL
jgi:8-oxo-dGTP pyrophosphatase MutT (NUDIX family)